ncbi:MAG: WD40 repeat domain-containing protein [Chitinispirillaceae bacterium]
MYSILSRAFLPVLTPFLVMAAVSGYVKDAETRTPLSNVIVTVDKMFLYDTTDTRGKFWLAYTSVRKSAREAIAIKPSIGSRGALHFALDKKTTVSIRVYSLRGRIIFSERQEFDRGTHAVFPGIPAAGLYLYTVRVGNANFVFKHLAIQASGRAPGKAVISRMLGRSTSLSKQATKGDTLLFEKSGYHPKRIPTAEVLANDEVFLEPVKLADGVSPGKWTICTSQGEEMYVYVNHNRRSVDSVVIPVRMNCISSSKVFTFNATGPFSIPENGAVSIGDTIALNFSGSLLSGEFSISARIAETNATPCEWTEVYNTGTAMMSHYSHVYKLGGVVKCSSRYFALKINMPHGRVEVIPDKAFYLPGDAVSIRPLADSTHTFRGWERDDDPQKPRNSQYWRTYMDTSKTFTARMVPNHRLTRTTDFGYFNIISPEEHRGYLFAEGDTAVCVTKTENEFHRFLHWSGDTSWTSHDTAWIVMDDDKSIADVFVEVYRWRSDNSPCGDVYTTSSKEYFAKGDNDTICVIAVPEEGSICTGWTGSYWKASGDTAWVIMDTTKRVSPRFVSLRNLVSFSDSSGNLFGPAALSFDNNRVAYFACNQVRCLDVPTRATLWEKRHHFSCKTLEFSPDNAMLAVPRLGGSTIFGGNGVLLLDAETGDSLRLLDSTGTPDRAVFSPDGEKILTASPYKMWDIATGALLFTFESSLEGIIAFSPDGKKMLLCDKDTLEVRDSDSGLLLLTIAREKRDDIIAARFTIDGESIVAATHYAWFMRFDAGDGTLLSKLKLEQPMDYISRASFSPDGSKAAIGFSMNRGYDLQYHILKVIESETGELIMNLDGHSEDIVALAYSDDGTRLVSAQKAREWKMEDAVIVWDMTQDR